MTIRVELYGIVRERVGVEAIDVEAATLGEVFTELEKHSAAFASACLENGTLRAGYLANIDGRTFTTDIDTPVTDGTTVLLLSADAGG